MLELYLRPVPKNDQPGGDEPNALVITNFPCVVGRHRRCDEKIDDLMISRRHFRFFLRDDWVWIEDLRSRNGTAINGERLARAVPLADGDVLQVGNGAFQVRLRSAADTLHEGLRSPAETAGDDPVPSPEVRACEAAAR